MTTTTERDGEPLKLFCNECGRFLADVEVSGKGMVVIAIKCKCRLINRRRIRFSRSFENSSANS